MNLKLDFKDYRDDFRDEAIPENEPLMFKDKDGVNYLGYFDGIQACCYEFIDDSDVYYPDNMNIDSYAELKINKE